MKTIFCNFGAAMKTIISTGRPRAPRGGSSKAVMDWHPRHSQSEEELV